MIPYGTGVGDGGHGKRDMGSACYARDLHDAVDLSPQPPKSNDSSERKTELIDSSKEKVN